MKIKNIIKKCLGKRVQIKLNYYRKLYRNDSRKSLKKFLKIKLYKSKNIAKSIKKLLSNVQLSDLEPNNKFYYSIDIFKIIDTNIENLSIDYNRILNYSLKDYKEKLKANIIDEKFYKDEINTIESIEFLIDRTVKKLQDDKCDENIINNIKNIKDKKANSLYEALQRILFFNQLLWQTSHKLNGLGRLDIILYPYYKKDIENEIINEEEAKNLIKEFLTTLHKYYERKSNVLLGDTGQIIELGGKDKNGKYQYNELTYIFIELTKELQLPDPKILLRVSSETPRDLIETSLKCIQTGIGCPLFANDDVVIDKLINFGYEKEDAYEYGTSACWEPFIIGKSLDQNNLKSINFLQPFENLLEVENVEDIKSTQQLVSLYKKYLEEYLDNFIKEIENKKFNDDPILSLFTDDCIEKNLDISKGGAKYNHYGFTGVGLSNLINSIKNVEIIIFKNKEMSFSNLNDARKNNYENNEELINKLKNQKIKYGTDYEEIINITNDIIKYTTQVINKYKNPLGGKYKFGLSAPSYIDCSKNFPASFDGRKNGEPFGVHISSSIENGYTELIQFASKLDYNENRFNGNVVDFIVSPSFIENNFDKFVDFIKLSIQNGFFEMQMNVVSSTTLIEARNNPEKFPNLIVRVWGFSAYFNDLPDQYKDYLIERALKSENNS